jgi:hypothetical protein
MTALKIGEPKSAIDDADIILTFIGPSKGESVHRSIASDSPLDGPMNVRMMSASSMADLGSPIFRVKRHFNQHTGTAERPQTHTKEVTTRKPTRASLRLSVSWHDCCG